MKEHIAVKDRLSWATSGGGPLILLPADSLLAWEGTEPPSSGRVVEAKFRWSGDPDAPATDYDRACDVDDYLGLVAVAEGEGLVLGEEGMDTAWLPDERGDAGILIRWRYAEEETDVIQAISRIPDDIWEPQPLVFTVGNGPLFLFDSAYSGSEVGEGLTETCVTIPLPAGQYALATAHYQPDDQTSFVLHRLSRKSEGT